MIFKSFIFCFILYSILYLVIYCICMCWSYSSVAMYFCKTFKILSIRNCIYGISINRLLIFVIKCRLADQNNVYFFLFYCLSVWSNSMLFFVPDICKTTCVYTCIVNDVTEHQYNATQSLPDRGIWSRSRL